MNSDQATIQRRPPNGLRLEFSIENVDAQVVADSLELSHVVGDLFDRFHLLLQVVSLDEIAALGGKKRKGGQLERGTIGEKRAASDAGRVSRDQRAKS